MVYFQKKNEKGVLSCMFKSKKNKRKEKKELFLLKCIKNKSVRNKFLFTFFILLIYEFGSKLTLPFINQEVLKQATKTNSLVSLINTVSGGSLDQMSLFAMGVGPFITASIVIQLLSSDVIPYLTQLKEQGEKGQVKTDRITRIVSIFCGAIQSFGIVYMLSSQQISTSASGVSNSVNLIDPTNYWYKIAFLVMVMVAGSMISLWFGDLIEEYGIGNGVSLLIFAGIVRRFPRQISTAISSLLTTYGSKGYTWASLYIVLIMVLVLLVVILQFAEIHLPIYRPSSIAKDKLNYLPIKVNTPGVMPVIFAASLMTVPLQLVYLFKNTDLQKTFENYLCFQTWYSVIIYVVLILLFSFFYTKVQIDPEKVSENLAKGKTVIPNVNPGKETEVYLNSTLNHIMVWGALGLVIIAAIPYVLPLISPAITSSSAIGGTGIIIVVGVLVECKIKVEGFIKENRYEKYKQL